MCAVFGAFVLDAPGASPTLDTLSPGFTQLYHRVQTIMNLAQDRGKDSNGLVFGGPMKQRGIELHCLRRLGPPKGNEVANLIKASHKTKVPSAGIACSFVMGNLRAEPTTEYMDRRTSKWSQPYLHDGVVMVHNGVISNDKDVAKRHEFTARFGIDSEVIPVVLSKCKSIEEVQTAFTQEMIGSFAVAAYLPRVGGKCGSYVMATNFKPLYYRWVAGEEVGLTGKRLLEFSSLNTHLEHREGHPPQRLRPYSMLVVDAATGESIHCSLYPDDVVADSKRNVKALIIASSGLDSTVAASWAKDKGYDITLLHFTYGCHAGGKEAKAMDAIAKALKAPLIKISTDFFSTIGGSNLIKYPGGKTPKISGGIEGAELAKEWVPARNLVFLSLATAIAEAKGFRYVVLGGNLEESGAYADNEYSFQKDFDDMLPGALNLNSRVNLLIPLGGLMKRGIVELGIELNAPLDKTWSCYKSMKFHCGECGPCFMRRTAFKMCGLVDPVPYMNPQKGKQ